MSVQWISILAFASLFMGIALYARFKTHNAQSFATGSGANPYILGISLASTLTSASTFIINPGLVYHYGLSAYLAFGVAANIGIISGLIILVKAFRKLGMDGKTMSVPQWIEKHYGGGDFVRVFYACISLLLIVFIVLIYVGLSLVLSELLNIDIQTSLISLIIVITFYNLIGGANGHILTNMIQGFIMIVVAIILTSSGWHFFFDGNFSQRLQELPPDFFQPTNPNSILYRDLFEVFIVNIVIGFAVVCQPHILSKGLFLKDDKSVNKMLTTGIVIGLLFNSVLLVGLYGRFDLGAGIKPDLMVPTYIMNHFSTPFQILASIGIMCAGISTLEAILLALTVTFSFDLVLPLKKKFSYLNSRISDSSQSLLTTGKILTTLCGVLVYFLSLDQIRNPNVSVAVFAFNGVYALFCATFIPIAAKAFAIKLSSKEIVISSILILCVHFGLYYGKISVPGLNASYWTNPGVNAVMALGLGILWILLKRAIIKVFKGQTHTENQCHCP